MLAETLRSAEQPPAHRWLLENGPKELLSLFRAIVYHPAVPILITDDDRTSREASAGAARLLGMAREKIIGRKLDDFAPPGFKPKVSELWRAFLAHGEQEGTLLLEGADGTPKVVEYIARTNVLPVGHMLALREKDTPAQIPSWAQDYALFLLDAGGRIVTWYEGAERIYGYTAKEAIGQNAGLLCSADHAPEDLKRASEAGHYGGEGWQFRKDGSRFWANVITMALRNGSGELEGFARIARDFSERHESDEQLRRKRASVRPAQSESAITGVVSGEFDLIPEANDTFLELVGYSREDLLAGVLRWLDLTPPEYAPLDELAHEEALRFGACTPYEKELIRRDGTRVPVLVAMAVLKLSPFRWIAFVQDLRARERSESVQEEQNDEERGITRDFDEIVGESAALKRVERLIEVVAPTDATVLIMGETGTGKELVARAIHSMSPRRNLPFVTLNCAAIPDGAAGERIIRL